MSIEEYMNQAFRLGQDYWRQVDSESYRQQDKSYETKAKFEELKAKAAEELQQ